MKLKHLAIFALLGGSILSAHAENLDVKQARAIITPFYEGLNAAPGRDAAALILKATSENWESCYVNDKCIPRTENVKNMAGFSKSIPDLKWEIREIIVSGDRVIVRGEASGTPAGELMGVPRGGKSFKLMWIDIHHIKDNKISGKTYHVEDWAGALKQLSAAN